MTDRAYPNVFSTTLLTDTIYSSTPNIVVERLSPHAQLPQHHGGSQHENIGLDFFSASDTPWQHVAEGIWTATVRTGLRMKLPHGYHLQFASRSGLAFRHNIYAFPGVVDSSYRGELMVKLIRFTNMYPEPICAGEKIAQGIVLRSLAYNIIEGSVDTDTSRGEAGFGSTDAAL